MYAYVSVQYYSVDANYGCVSFVGEMIDVES
jgi:hypothetical protein